MYITERSPSEDHNVSSQPFYPPIAEKIIVDHIRSKNTEVIDIFQKTVDSIYAELEPDKLKGNNILKKFYLDIIALVFVKFAWTKNFINISEYESGVFQQSDEPGELKAYYVEKLGHLTDFINKFDPVTSDGTIRNICLYILENSESEIKLKTLANRFYINHTYLSGIFRQKSGLSFNDYTTAVKMARARYLFKVSTLKTYEIANRLGYKDIDHFSGLFKKYSGNSPSDFKKTTCT